MAMLHRIKNCPGYRIERSGQVWNCKDRDKDHWFPLSIGTYSSGHRYVSLFLDGKCVNKAIHRLLLETFVGPCPEGMECRHLDDDPNNNNLDNLCWGTRKQNIADRRRHGTAPPATKLTEAKVRRIRKLLSQGHTQVEVAAMFGVTQTNISCIVRGKTWVNT